jgi:hypothetical protein
MPLESTLSPITALESVNGMLLSIGQGTIDSLDFSESVDAENAKIALIDASRTAQARGWYFNTDRCYRLPVAVDGTIAIPGAVLSFVADPEWSHVVLRSNKLYDTDNNTFIFPAGTTVTGTVKWYLPFEDLPQVARDYIHRRAGRVFQIGAVGSDLLYRFTKEMEDETRAALEAEDLRVRRPNPLNHDAHIAYTTGAYRLRR